MVETFLEIFKAAGKKANAIRISQESDIPDFLSESVLIQGGKIFLNSSEKTAPLGSVIGYEKSDTTKSGYITWHIINPDTCLVEVNRNFYQKAKVFLASPVTHHFPKFIDGANIIRNSDGSWSIITDFGISTGFPGKAYWILSGKKEDGTPDANIISNYEDYYACDYVTGEEIGPLSEIAFA